MSRSSIAITLSTLLSLQLLTACGGDSKRPTDEPPKLDIAYDTSLIVKTETYPGVVRGDYTLVFTAYRNPAYPCKGSGVATFVTMEREDRIGTESPLWIEMHGGAQGYYRDDGVYMGETDDAGAPMNISEENPENLVFILMTFLSAGVEPDAIPDSRPFEDPNFIATRVLEGARVLMPSMCELDLYGGIGDPEVGNPREDARRTGLLATMAAIDFIASNNSSTPTSQVYLDGHSAGSAGAWHVVQGFTNNGIRLNGAILDSLFVSERVHVLPVKHCAQVLAPDITQAEIDAELAFWDGFLGAVSPFTRDRSYWVANALGTKRGVVPIFAIEGAGDFLCGGAGCPLFSEAADAGFTRNCDYVLDPIRRAVEAAADRGHRFLITDDPPDHQVSHLKGPHQAELETWFQATKAINNTAPWPRK